MFFTYELLKVQAQREEKKEILIKIDLLALIKKRLQREPIYSRAVVLLKLEEKITNQLCTRNHTRIYSCIPLITKQLFTTLPLMKYTKLHAYERITNKTTCSLCLQYKHHFHLCSSNFTGTDAVAASLVQISAHFLILPLKIEHKCYKHPSCLINN